MPHRVHKSTNTLHYYTLISY